jgi:hypothetical protein
VQHQNLVIVKSLATTTQDWGTYWQPSFVSASKLSIHYLSKSTAQADDTNLWGIVHHLIIIHLLCDWNGYKS